MSAQLLSGRLCTNQCARQNLMPGGTLIHSNRYSDVIMSAMLSQVIEISGVCSTVGLGADQRKHQIAASLAFVRGIHRWSVVSPHKGPVTRKMFPFYDVSCVYGNFHSTATSSLPSHIISVASTLCLFALKDSPLPGGYYIALEVPFLRAWLSKSHGRYSRGKQNKEAYSLPYRLWNAHMLFVYLLFIHLFILVQVIHVVSF